MAKKKSKTTPCGCRHNEGFCEHGEVHEHHGCCCADNEEHKHTDGCSCADGCGCGHNHISDIKISIIRLIAGGIFFTAGIATKCVPLIIVSYIIFGYDVIIGSVRNILKGEFFDESFLMTIATIGAFVIGEYTEGAAVMLFYQIGETLSAFAVSKSRRGISELMDIRPDTAFVERGGEFVNVSPENVAVGETVLVKAGERIPVDGTVIKGEAYLDKSALTGESVPVHAKSGTKVQSGSINKDGTLYICTDKEYSDSTASRILRLVDSAQKSKSERFITRFAKIYTPVVVCLALAVAVIPPIFKIGTFSEWIYRALIFLVVSCPCALVVSIPLTFFAGIGRASRSGILVKGSDVIERLAEVKTMIFDKTGTLTHGVFDVAEISGDDTLRLCAYAEYYSNHPVSTAVKRAFDEKIDTEKISGYTELAGMGIRALIDGKEVLCGNKALMDKYGVTITEESLEGTVIYVSENGEYKGNIVISDIVKENSKKTVKALGTFGIDAVMLTGDSENSARTAAKKLGIENVYSQLMPDDKVRICSELSQSGTAAFVGDGINDAPVLACADVGFAMGALGSDAAIEAADAVIMNDDPYKTVDAVRIARKTNIIAKQNIVIAIGIKAGVMLLGILGIATMWTAVFADVGVTLIAVCNALRALKK